jgi:hypothetical protein
MLADAGKTISEGYINSRLKRSQSGEGDNEGKL